MKLKEFVFDYFRDKYNIVGNFEVIVNDPWEPLDIVIEDSKQQFMYKLRGGKEITFDSICFEYTYKCIRKAAQRKTMFNMLRQIDPQQIDAAYNNTLIRGNSEGPRGKIRTLTFLSQMHFKGFVGTKLIKKYRDIWYEGAEKRMLSDL